MAKPMRRMAIEISTEADSTQALWMGLISIRDLALDASGGSLRVLVDGHREIMPVVSVGRAAGYGAVLYDLREHLESWVPAQPGLSDLPVPDLAQLVSIVLASVEFATDRLPVEAGVSVAVHVDLGSPVILHVDSEGC